MGGPRKKGELTVVVDTREQRPYEFDGQVVSTLKSGDYSVLGMEGEVAIERKSKADLYGTVGAGRDRFERELERLAAFRYAAIVVESDMAGLLERPPRTEVSPAAVVNSLISWSVRYGVHVFLAGSRDLGQTTTLRILEKYAKHRGE